jgi:hypothetical protein
MNNNSSGTYAKSVEVKFAWRRLEVHAKPFGQERGVKVGG